MRKKVCQIIIYVFDVVPLYPVQFMILQHLKPGGFLAAKAEKSGLIRAVIFISKLPAVPLFLRLM